MNRKIISAIVGIFTVGTMSVSAFAVPLKAGTWKGQLLDLNCYSAHGLKGRTHGRVCGKKCLLSGAPAGILINGQAWTLDANPRPLAPFVGMKIQVKGQCNTHDHVLLPTIIKVDDHGTWKTIRLIPLFKPVK